MNLTNQKTAISGVIQTIEGTFISAKCYLEPYKRPRIEINTVDRNQLPDLPDDILKGYFESFGKVAFYECRIRKFAQFEYIVDCNYAILGAYLEKKHLLFRRINIQSEQLSSWIKNSTIEIQNKKDDKRIFVVKDPYEIDSFTVADIKVSFNTGSKIEAKRNTVSIESNISIGIGSEEGSFSIDALFSKVESFKHLFTMLTGNILSVDVFTLHHEDYKKGNEYFPLKLYKEEDPNKKISVPDITFDYEEVKSCFGKFLTNWFTDLKLKPIAERIYSNYYVPSLDVVTRFLNASFSLETFHRRYYKNEAITQKEFKERKKYLTQTLSEKPEIREWIMIRLAHAYEPTFAERFDDFKEYVSFFTQNEEKTELFIQVVKENRNYYVHYGKKTKYVLEGKELYHLSLQLQCLVKVVIFIKLGIDESIVLKKLYNVKKPLRFVM